MTGEYFIGLMSGTSLDGVDGVIVRCDPSTKKTPFQLIETYFLPYDTALKQVVLGLQYPAENELETMMRLGNHLARLYAQATQQLLEKAKLCAHQVCAIGCHGQTVRHQPRLNNDIGFSVQIVNPALLAELTKITVISDFRSRDIAAGGEGAPLVPAFHAEVFASDEKNRAIVNIGGIANVTYLPAAIARSKQAVFGFDTGPGNMLMDAWINTHLQQDYDKHGAWAATGKILAPLLERMLEEHYFRQVPPKSTGRDLFDTHWLASHVSNNIYAPQDVARTLVELTACTIVDALAKHCPNTDEVYVCGGGAHNDLLMNALEIQLQAKFSGNIRLKMTDVFGIGVDWVEAMAFAWLAKKCMSAEPANLPAVTGAQGQRILGSITQA